MAGSDSTQSPPALPSAYVPGLRLAATRMRATKDARLGRQLRHWLLHVFKWTSRRPGHVGATHAFGRPGDPT